MQQARQTFSQKSGAIERADDNTDDDGFSHFAKQAALWLRADRCADSALGLAHEIGVSLG